MYEEQQLRAAQADMTAWLSDPHELGKAPDQMVYVGKFVYHAMQYYIFKFKASVDGKWLVGVCGGFEKDALEPCGHTFSQMQPYNAQTAQADCISMVERIMAYWKERVQKLESSDAMRLF